MQPLGVFIRGQVTTILHEWSLLSRECRNVFEASKMNGGFNPKGHLFGTALHFRIPMMLPAWPPRCIFCGKPDYCLTTFANIDRSMHERNSQDGSSQHLLYFLYGEFWVTWVPFYQGPDHWRWAYWATVVGIPMILRWEITNVVHHRIFKENVTCVDPQPERKHKAKRRIWHVRHWPNIWRSGKQKME